MEERYSIMLQKGQETWSFDYGIDEDREIIELASSIAGDSRNSFNLFDFGVVRLLVSKNRELYGTAEN